MVLSNKKLKQKLRFLLAESLSTSETSNHDKPHDDVTQQLQNLREALGSRRSQRPRPPRKKSKINKENEETHENGGDEIESGGGKKRRKIEEPVTVKGNKDNSNKKKSNKKKEKKRKRREGKKKVVSLGEGDEKPKEELSVPKREESVDSDKKVYVGGIPYYSTEEDIISFFEGCGTVTEVDCMKFPESGKFRGIAILTFKTEGAAKRALDFDGADMGGFYLKIQTYKPSRPTITTATSDFAPELVDGYNRTYVGNLSWEITEDELRKFFSGCNISSIRFGEDKETGEFKGYAHVDFSDKDSLTAALKLDQSVVCGRPVRIRCAVPPLKKTSKNPRSAADANEARLCSQVESKIPEVDSGLAKGKKKRRTCYNCGIPGHISAECPKKKADDANEK